MKALAAVKCPFCKGATNNDRKTLYLYPSDTYWCARCKEHGLISDLNPNINLLQGIAVKNTAATKLERFEYNNTGDRFSVCKNRYSDATRDTFQIKLPDGSVVGHYTRYPGKRNKIEGIKGFCYRESFLDFSQTYRIVEGVYDCSYPNDIAVLGYPTEYQAKQLKWFKLILCPDGDVWKEKDNLKRWLSPFWYFKNVVVEYIPNFKDPDEVVQDQRKQVEFYKVKEYLNK